MATDTTVQWIQEYIKERMADAEDWPTVLDALVQLCIDCTDHHVHDHYGMSVQDMVCTVKQLYPDLYPRIQLEIRDRGVWTDGHCPPEWC